MGDAMIDGLRRHLSRSVQGDPWDANQELRHEVEEASELQTDAAVILAAGSMARGFYPGDRDPTDYYKSIVKIALANGGKYGDHQIPIPWLRMILAGLESRPIDPEMMWYEVDADNEASVSPEAPSYDDLFPSDREAPTGPN